MEEVEILVELFTEIEKAKESLSSFDFIGSKATIDNYYYDPLRPDFQLNESGKLMNCCRVRQKGGVCTFTCKKDIYDGEIWQYSEEYETQVIDQKMLTHILEKLGLKPLVTISSVKNIYASDCYELVLETVENLGNFLEVEFKGYVEKDNVVNIKQGINKLIASLSLSVGPELNSGKPELLLVKKNKERNV